MPVLYAGAVAYHLQRARRRDGQKPLDARAKLVYGCEPCDVVLGQRVEAVVSPHRAHQCTLCAARVADHVARRRTGGGLGTAPSQPRGATGRSGSPRHRLLRGGGGPHAATQRCSHSRWHRRGAGTPPLAGRSRPGDRCRSGRARGESLADRPDGFQQPP